MPLFHHHTDTENCPPLEVERIRYHREGPGGLEVLMHWKGTPNSSDTWERPESFVSVLSEVWVEYCKENALFWDVHEIPVYQPPLARVLPE